MFSRFYEKQKKQKKQMLVEAGRTGYLIYIKHWSLIRSTNGAQVCFLNGGRGETPTMMNYDDTMELTIQQRFLNNNSLSHLQFKP